MFIRKRNGNLVEFNRNKIKKAIDRCIVEVNNDTMEEEFYISKLISIDIEKKYRDNKKEKNEHLIIEIEEIQDEVENLLMKYELYDIAKSYILYREKHKEIRDKHARLYEESQKVISEVMEGKGIENSNANVDEGSFSGKNSKITEHFLKDYSLNNLMDEKVANGHKEGKLYTHDINNYGNGMHNCLFIDFEDLFENNGGFATRNGDVRKPNDIMTFFQLVAVTFQCQSQVQYGGVGANKIDYDGAKYVGITFKKCYKDAIMDYVVCSEETAKQHMKNIEEEHGDIIKLENEKLMSFDRIIYNIAERHTIKKTLQGAESLYHNLNTLNI